MKYICKYCDTKLIIAGDNDICCPDCGLIYKITYDRNEEDNKLIACEGIHVLNK